MSDAQAIARRRRLPSVTDFDYLVQTGLSEAITRAIPEIGRAGETVLDMGAGSMPYREDFLAAGLRYVGADIDDSAEVRIAPDGTLPLPESSVDVVVSFQVLEHVADISRYLSEARRVLRPGGRLLLSTHGSWLYHPHPTDYRRWTREGLRHDLAEAGFATDRMDAVVGPLALTTIFRTIGFVTFLKPIPLVGRALSAVIGVIMNARAALEDRITPEQIRRDNACVYIATCRKA
jgi:SAM-dependent methyltransferase